MATSTDSLMLEALQALTTRLECIEALVNEVLDTHNNHQHAINDGDTDYPDSQVDFYNKNWQALRKTIEDTQSNG